jgi:hypothetical protein
LPVDPHTASHTVSTLATQLAAHVPEQQVESTAQIAATQGSHAALKAAPAVHFE